MFILKKENYNTNNFEAQFKRSTIPLLVLQLLTEREMYAYEIIQETLKRSDGKYKMPLLYNILNKFRDQGYIIESRNRIRIYYAITPSGCEYLLALKKEYSILSESVRQIVFNK